MLIFIWLEDPEQEKNKYIVCFIDLYSLSLSIFARLWVATNFTY